MLVGDFPRSRVPDKDHRGAVPGVDHATCRIERTVEDESGDARVAEDIDLQRISPHLETVGRPQTRVFTLAAGFSILSLGG